jgi:hypothetical protein
MIHMKRLIYAGKGHEKALPRQQPINSRFYIFKQAIRAYCLLWYKV